MLLKGKKERRNENDGEKRHRNAIKDVVRKEKKGLKV